MDDGDSGPQRVAPDRPSWCYPVTIKETAMVESFELTYDECEDLLRAGVLGRIGLSTPCGPEIIPVNYTVVGSAILARTAPGTTLDRFVDGASVVLEVDGANYDRRHGWSVVARGRAERVTAEQLTEDERRAPGPPAWVAREQESWIRLPWVTLTGRRIGRGWQPLSELPVRARRS